METEVLDEIQTRSECLMEMFGLIQQEASDKPDKNMVDSIDKSFKIKS